MVKVWRKKIIDFYLIKEILTPFSAGVAIITVIMLGGILYQLTDLIIVQDIPFDVVLRLLIYQMPEIIVQTFPMAILFATMFGMSRLNRESEFTALRMGGISLYRLIIPLLIIGIIISALTYYLNEEVVPWSNHEARNIIRRSILKINLPDVQEGVFFQGPRGRLFYVGRYDEISTEMERVVIYNFPQRREFPEIITAEAGMVIENNWRLEDGIIHQYSEDGSLIFESRFDVLEIELAQDMGELLGRQRTTSEMSRADLKKQIELFQRSGLSVNSLLVDYHIKLATPLAALIFILIGTPLSLSSKDSRSASIVLTIVVIFLYYLLQSSARSFGRNGRISPLLAAWLPNISIGFLGVILLIWRESWQKWLNKFMPFLVVFFLILLSCSVPISASNLDFSADSLSYDNKTGQLEASGNISGRYNPFYIKADKVTVVLNDGSKEVIRGPEEIFFTQTKFSGCEKDHFHYHFSASELTIYPNKYLLAKHVVFWEFNGRLPLFYWPYLYIPLEDKPQSFMPEFGYSASRGYFVKTTYRYWYGHLPGEIYLDYYTRSGFGAGFKQELFAQEDLQGNISFYAQENRINLPSLYLWQGALQLNKTQGQLRTDTDVNYTYYDDYSLLNGKVNLRNWGENQRLDISSDFTSRDYFKQDDLDKKTLELDFRYDLDLGHGWDLRMRYDQDYQLTPADGLINRWGTSSFIRKRTANTELTLLMERDDPRLREEDGVRFYRWPELGYKYTPRGPLTYNLLLGRYFESATDISGYRTLSEVVYNNRWSLNRNISFSTRQTLTAKGYQLLEDNERWALEELNLDYYHNTYQGRFDLRTNITSNLSWNNRFNYATYKGETPFRFDDRGREEEKIDTSLIYRRRPITLNLDTAYDFLKEAYSPLKSRLTYRQGAVNLRVDTGYDIEEKEYLPLKTRLDYRQAGLNLRVDAGYDFQGEEYLPLEKRLNYRQDGLNFNLESGYDFAKKEYLPIETSTRWQINPKWQIGLELEYDLNEKSFIDEFIFNNKYEDQIWTIKADVEMDLNEKKVLELDSKLTYKLEENLYIELNTVYDYQENGFEKANILLKKNLHCREIWFSYDHLIKEFMIGYSINLFPEQEINLGTSENDPFIFDFGGRDLFRE